MSERNVQWLSLRNETAGWEWEIFLLWLLLHQLGLCCQWQKTETQTALRNEWISCLNLTEKSVGSFRLIYLLTVATAVCLNFGHMPHTVLYDIGLGAFGWHQVVRLLYCYLVPLKKGSSNSISQMKSGHTDSDTANEVDELMFLLKNKKISSKGRIQGQVYNDVTYIYS